MRKLVKILSLHTTRQPRPLSRVMLAQLPFQDGSHDQSPSSNSSAPHSMVSFHLGLARRRPIRGPSSWASRLPASSSRVRCGTRFELCFNLVVCLEGDFVVGRNGGLLAAVLLPIETGMCGFQVSTVGTSCVLCPLLGRACLFWPCPD